MSSILDDLKLQYKIGGMANKLIYWNVALFAIPYIAVALLTLFNIHFNFIKYVSVTSDPADLLWKPWSLFTYAFFHGGILHILFNMMVLNFASRLFTTFFSGKQLLSVYFSSAIFAAIVYIASYHIFPALEDVDNEMVGASGAIMAILIAAVTMAPLMEIRLMLIGRVKLWQIALVLIVIDLVQLPMDNTGGHLAHLGGAFFGFIYVKQLQRGTDLGLWFTKIMNLLANIFGTKAKTPFKKVHKNYAQSVTKPVSKIITKDKTQQQIDEILDKISQSGYDSLTKDEKEFLFKSGK